jgi:hypothetical protein
MVPQRLEVRDATNVYDDRRHKNGAAVASSTQMFTPRYPYVFLKKSLSFRNV